MTGGSALIVIERRRKRKYKQQMKWWLVLGSGLGSATIILVSIFLFPKLWRQVESGQLQSDLERAISERPYDAKGWYDYGWYLINREDTVTGLKYLERSVELGPSNLVFGNDFRLQCVQLKEYQRAIDFFVKVARDHPSLLEPHLQLALAYADRAAAEEKDNRVARGEWLKKSIKQLSHLIQMDQREPDEEQRKHHADTAWMGNYFRGRLYVHSTENQSLILKGVADFRRCIEKQKDEKLFNKPQPFFVLPYVAVCDAFAKSGDVQQARLALKEGNRLFPEHQEILKRKQMSDEQLLTWAAEQYSPDVNVNTDLSTLSKGSGA
jgi:tetratricopeptide (TPR) repeat protein